MSGCVERTTSTHTVQDSHDNGTTTDMERTYGAVFWRFSMTIKTQKFQGTHLWDRLCWAKNLEGKQSDYRIVWEDPDAPEECSKITVPDPNWMACALQGGILPPVEVYWALAEDETNLTSRNTQRGYLLQH